MDQSRWGFAGTGLFGLMVLAWAGNYLFVREGELFVAPLWLATFRAAVGAACVGGYLTLHRGTQSLSRAERRDALLLGLPNTAIFLGLWFTAEASVPPGEASVLIYTFPLWVALFSPLVLRSRLGPGHWLAVGTGFLGVVLVSQPWTSGNARPPLGPVLELLLAAVSWAAATVSFQRRFRPEAMLTVNGVQLLGGAAGLAVVAALFAPVTGHWAAPALWLSIAWLGVFGTAFAYGVWFYLLGSTHAASLSAFAFLVPLLALALSVVLVGERVDGVQAAGVAAVLVGVYLVGRGSAAARPPPQGR